MKGKILLQGSRKPTITTSMFPAGLESTGLNDIHDRPASALSDMSINLQVKIDNKFSVKIAYFSN